MMSLRFSWRQGLFLLAPLITGSLALRFGMDASWDLRNYHYYNGWALLTGHIDRDLLVAQTPSFYNPLLDLPFAWAEPRFDARLLAFGLGALHSANFILLTLLGETLLAGKTRRPFAVAALLAATGCGGAVALSELGTLFYDTVTSLGLFGSLLLLVRNWTGIAGGAAGRAALAGLPIGLAFGLKQTMILYPLGLGVGLLLTLPGGIPKKLTIGTAFAAGVALATLVTGGFWMLHLWRAYGNPLFPYFNQIFQSPWAQSGDYRDTHFQPHGLINWLLFPLFIAADSRLASEVDFQDWRLAAAVRDGASRAAAAPAASGCPVAGHIAIAYGVWLLLFDIYRYLVALEMLAPLMVALILLELAPRWRWPATLLATLAVLVSTRPAQWIRVPFRPRAVEVTLPAIADPDHSLVLLAGHEPLSFLIPAFPAGMAFLADRQHLHQSGSGFGALQPIDAEQDRAPSRASVALVHSHRAPRCGETPWQ